MSRAVRMTLVGLLGCLLPVAALLGYCMWEYDRIWSPMPLADAIVIQQYEDEIVVRWQDRSGEVRSGAIGLYDTSEFPPQERIEILYDLEHPKWQVIPLETPASGLPYEDSLIEHGLAALASGSVVILLWTAGWAARWAMRWRLRERAEAVVWTRGGADHVSRRRRWWLLLIPVWLVVGVLVHVLNGDPLTVATAVTVVAVLTSTLVLVDSLRPLLPEVESPHAKRLSAISVGGSMLICAGLGGYGVFRSVSVDTDDSRLGGYYLLVIAAVLTVLVVHLARRICLGDLRVAMVKPSQTAQAGLWRDEHGRLWLELWRSGDEHSLWQRITWDSSVESLADGQEVDIRGRFKRRGQVMIVVAGQVLTPRGRLRTDPPDRMDPATSDASVAPAVTRWWWRNAAIDYGFVLIAMAIAVQLKDPMSVEALLITLLLMTVLLLNVWASAGTRPNEGIARLPWRR